MDRELHTEDIIFLGVYLFLFSLFTILNCFAAFYKCSSHSETHSEGNVSSGGPECGICCGEYGTSGGLVPRVLSCGHTFCGICIMKFVEKRVGLEFSCPFCMRKSPFYKPTIMAYFSINHILLEKLRKTGSHSMKCKTCHKDYSSQESSITPLIHVECGHTSCEACVEMNTLRYEQVVCLTCGAMPMERPGDKRKHWKSVVPINYAIRDMLEL